MTHEQTVGALVSRCLRAAGIVRAFASPGHGRPAPEGITIVPVPDSAMAIALADADGRLSCAPTARPGLALLPDGRFRLSSQPGAFAMTQPLEVEDIPAAIAGWSFGQVHAASEFEIPAESTAMVAESLQPLVLRRSDQLLRLSSGLAEFRTMIVVGPGVTRDGFAADVVDAAVRVGAGVMVTIGAVGVVRFDHPLWRGVVGVQSEDPALGGLDDCDLVIAVGVDPEELGESVPADAQVLEIEPWHLAFLATDWPAPSAGPGDRGSLVDACAAVLGDHRSDESLPLHPVRAVLDVFDATGPDVRVFADAGPAGLWFVRGVVPVAPGRVIVPALASDGFAVAAAIIAALDGEQAIAITTPGSALVGDLLELAVDFDLDLVVEQWGDDVDAEGPALHRAGIVNGLAGGGVQLTGIAVDLAAAAELVELAGSVVAWTPTD